MSLTKEYTSLSKWFLLCVFFFASILVPVSVSALQTNPLGGLKETVKTADLADPTIREADGPALLQIAGRIIANALSILGVLFFILLVYAGFLWMTARGDETQINKAKDTTIAAIIGVIVIIAAYAITNLVFTSAGSSSPNGTVPSGPSCKVNSECPGADTLCDKGTCRSILDGTACQKNADCANNLVCTNGQCVANFDGNAELGLQADPNADLVLPENENPQPNPELDALLNGEPQ